MKSKYRPYPPDGGLKKPVRKPAECFSAFEAISKKFGFKLKEKKNGSVE